MMWFTILCLLGVIGVLMVRAIQQALRVFDMGVELEAARRGRAREVSLRAATEVAFCALVEEQLGDRLRSNIQRVSETTARFGKARGDGRGPN